jgi:hypothetical protein
MTQPIYKAVVEPRKPGPTGSPGLDQLAWLMDRAIQIPGTKITVGLDALLGLLPVGGDFVTGLIQTGIVLVALFHYRVPRAVAARMAANVLLDTTLGAIPLLGDVFDVFFKANTRNVQLLRQVEQERRQHQEVNSWPSIAYLVFLVLALVTLLGLLLIGFCAVVAWLFHLAR